MFDGSHYPIEENVAKTKELVKICAEHGMSLEAEVGSIGGEEDGVIGMGECADPNECKMIADLGIDFLAAGIGNIHGKYPANWKGLSFETLDAVQKLTGDMPSGSSRRYRYPDRYDQESNLPWRFQDQCKHRVPACFCRSYP